MASLLACVFWGRGFPARVEDASRSRPQTSPGKNRHARTDARPVVFRVFDPPKSHKQVFGDPLNTCLYICAKGNKEEDECEEQEDKEEQDRTQTTKATPPQRPAGRLPGAAPPLIRRGGVQHRRYKDTHTHTSGYVCLPECATHASPGDL